MKKNKELKKLVGRYCKFCFVDGQVDERKVERVIKDLKSLPRSQAIFAISEFLNLLKKQKGQTTLLIESSIPLPKPQSNYIAGKLKKHFLVTEAKNIVNPTLLGGFKVRIGDTVLDYSLQNKISQLKKAVAII